MNRFIYKYIWILFLIGIVSFCGYSLEAALGEEKADFVKKSIKMSLGDIGRGESELAKTADLYTTYLIEQKWRREINEIGRQLEKKGVKISRKILEAIITAFGIDWIGPFTGEDLTNMGFPLLPIDPKLVAEYMEFMEDVEEAAPETKSEAASPSS